MYTTYGIFDPVSRLCVYIGQTNDLDRRRRQHLKTHRQRKEPARGSLQAWLIRIHKAGREPLICALEHVETEEQSLASENRWVELFAEIGHPLFNRWDEHRELIDAGMSQALDALTFKGPKARRIGRAEPNASKTGYRLHLEKAAAAGEIIDLLPPKAEKSEMES